MNMATSAGDSLGSLGRQTLAGSNPLTGIGIGITTRDRWADLAASLDRLRQNPDFTVDQIIVIDDGSQVPCPDEIKARFSEVEFIRNEHSGGYITQRNRLARLLRTDYYLSLDDDSFPIVGGLKGAADFMRARPQIFCLAFNLVSSISETPPRAVDDPPAQVRYFIGCAHMLDRRKFLEIGGYHEELCFYNEEWEISARIVGYGWQVVCYPAVVICHERSMVNRFSAHRSFYFTRGKMIFTLWTVPTSQLPFRLAVTPLSCLRWMALRDWPAALQGAVQGVWQGLKLLKHKRKPLSSAAYSQWRQCPWPPCQTIRTPDAQATT